MRTERIEWLRKSARVAVEPLPDQLRGLEDLQHFRIARRSLPGRFSDLMATTAIRLTQPRIKKLLKADFPWRYDHIVLGERWSSIGLRKEFENRVAVSEIKSALVQGCWLGDAAVQYWMKLGIPLVHGVELINMQACWQKTAPMLEKHFGGKVQFHHAKIEDVPLPDGSIDAISSDAVWEHVCNLEAATRETARLLRPGGYVLHNIGPLYFGYAGDHCIASYGMDAGYDHLLLTEEDYRKRVSDQEFFNSTSDPKCNGWALAEKFSFATVSEYLEHFLPLFSLEYMIVKISNESLQYRANWPERWSKLIDAGVKECDLLVSGINVVLRKKD